jgi:hypothetical protein
VKASQLITVLKKFSLPLWTVPLALLAAVALAYGLLAKEQGFYWDDWPFVWLSHFYGRAGFAEYFSTNRPLRTYFYATLFPLLGENALTWQLFAMLWRWLTGVTLWGVLRQVWPKRTVEITWLVLLFLVYPGFSQQFIAINYSNFFFLETLFFLSLWLMLRAARRGDHYRLVTLAGVLLSAVHLFSLEYFALQDALRPVFLWIVLAEAYPDRRERLKRTLLQWLPYALVLGAYLYWRVFIFRFQTYQPELINEVGATSGGTLLSLPLTVLNDLITVSLGAWLHAFQIPDPASFGTISTVVYVALVAISLVAFTVYLIRLVAESEDPPRLKQALAWVGLGLLSMLLAGGVYWVTRLQIRLSFPNDRFTLSFALGVSFLVVGLLMLVPQRRWLTSTLVGLLVAFAIGTQFQNANLYRRDWDAHKGFFWQMVWRAPELKPGTLLLSYESPFTYFTDNSLTAPINWTYAPENTTDKMDVAYFFITVRLGHSLPALEKGLPIHQGFLGPTFDGSTSQMIVMHYAPPACLRMLNPAYDVGVPLLPPLTKDALPLSNLDQIVTDPSTASVPPKKFFGPEPEHLWCYYFEKADLARQLGDWEEIVRLGDKAFKLGDYPNEASERVVFIEGYARVGRFADALKLTRQSIKITPLMKKMLCDTWARIGSNSTEALKAAADMQAELKCAQP